MVSTWTAESFFLIFPSSVPSLDFMINLPGFVELTQGLDSLLWVFNDGVDQNKKS